MYLHLSSFFRRVLNYLFLILLNYNKFIYLLFVANTIKLPYRFSSDPETSMGLVQLEGGPCGVLAAIQVMVPFFSCVLELVECSL